MFISRLKSLTLTVALMICPITSYASSEIEVDAALVILTDFSPSMSTEFIPLYQAYADALNDPAVQDAFLSGFTGRLAVTAIEAKSRDLSRTLIPWTIVQTREDIRRLAYVFSTRFDHVEDMQDVYATGTDIAGGLLSAHEALRELPYKTSKRVIDYALDGDQNVRHEDVDSWDDFWSLQKELAWMTDTTINALVIEIHGTQEGLHDFVNDKLISGPMNFVKVIRHSSEIKDAVRRKFLIEMSNAINRQ